jgi:hypothetical protein
MQTHYSWNAGLMPMVSHPKTTNTLCGLRAPRSRIDNKKPTCPDCIEAMQDRKHLPERLSAALARVTKA